MSNSLPCGPGHFSALGKKTFKNCTSWHPGMEETHSAGSRAYSHKSRSKISSPVSWRFQSFRTPSDLAGLRGNDFGLNKKPFEMVKETSSVNQASTREKHFRQNPWHGVCGTINLNSREETRCPLSAGRTTISNNWRNGKGHERTTNIRN